MSAPRVHRVRAVLAFEEAGLSFAGAGGGAAPVDLRLSEGEIAWVRVAEPGAAAALTAAAMGLAAPASGAVRFAGLDWRDLGREQASALRGRIGLLLPPDQWAPHLSLAENIILRPLHHTDRPVAALIEEASRIARRFGLPGAPSGPPGAATRDERWRASLTRMMMDAPRLVLIDEIATPIPPHLTQDAANAALSAARAGVAVLWLTGPGAAEGAALLAGAVAYRLDRFGFSRDAMEAAR